MRGRVADAGSTRIWKKKVDHGSRSWLGPARSRGAFRFRPALPSVSSCDTCNAFLFLVNMLEPRASANKPRFHRIPSPHSRAPALRGIS